jgi:SWI/SNF-related matrix-associated actin-dependent regulator of chromatin subfamily A3
MKTRLDLTAASRVHLLEPQWNPMAEEQALDRVHRLGQTREVQAIRYIVRDSIEEVSHGVMPDMTEKPPLL